MVAALRGGAALAVGIDHEHYRHEARPVPAPVRAALIADLALSARGRRRRTPTCYIRAAQRPQARQRHGTRTIGMTQSYTASDIEVLSGLEPVRRRPGMYTHTSRPNHLAHEVIDNSVDEAIAGHCKQIDVTLYKDGSLRGGGRRPRHAGRHPSRRRRSAASS